MLSRQMQGFLKQLRRTAVAAAWAAAFFAALPAAAEDYDPVAAKTLADNPQRYWARGVVFKDVLLERATSQAVQLDKQRTYPFRTKTVGECYVDEKLRTVLNDLETGKEYIFSGTVFHRKGGWRREERFFVVVNGVVTTARQLETLGVEIERVMAVSTTGVYAASFRGLEEILTKAQELMLPYARSENIELRDMLDPASPHFDKASQAIRNAMFERENTSKTPSLEFFVQLLTAFLALKEGAAIEAPAAVDLPPAEAPAEESVVPDIMAPPGAETPPPEAPAPAEPPITLDVPAEEIAAPAEEPPPAPAEVNAPPAEVVLTPEPEPAVDVAPIAAPADTAKPRRSKKTQPLPEPEAAPVVEPVAEPVAEPVVEPVVEPVTEPVTESVNEVDLPVPMR